MKTCTHCKIEKAKTEFGAHSSSKDGLKGECKQCRRVKNLAYYYSNAQAFKRRNAENRLKNPEETKIKDAEHRKQNADRINAAHIKYRANRTESIRITSARYNAKNVEKNKARKKAYRAKKAEQIRIADAEYRLKNKERVAEYNKVWKINNPEKSRVQVRNRRARLKECDGTHTASDIQNLLSVQAQKCVYCEKDISVKYHVDHIMPIARGGSNDKSNLQLLCPTCNHRKSAKHPAVYAQECKNRIINALV